MSGRKKATGKFNSRKELEESVRKLRWNLGHTNARIAVICGVSVSVVSAILRQGNNPEKKEPPASDRGAKNVTVSCKTQEQFLNARDAYSASLPYQLTNSQFLCVLVSEFEKHQLNSENVLNNRLSSEEVDQ